MVAIFSTSFDSQTSGNATMTSTGANAGEVGTPSPSLQHSTTQKLGGAALACSGTATTFFEWSLTNKPKVLIRLYFYRESAPSAGVCDFANIVGNSTNARLAFAPTTGALLVKNYGSAVATYPINAGQWYRADWTAEILFVGQSVRLYTGATLHSSNIADAVAGGATLSMDGFDNLHTFRLGQIVAANPATVFYIDEVAADSATMPPPFVPPATGGRPKVWTGSAWATKPAKVWSGSAWVEKPAKVWTGSTWKTVT